MRGRTSVEDRRAGYVLQDWAANKGNLKGRIVCVLFRTAQLARQGNRFSPAGLPVLVAYRVLVEWVLGVEIPWGTTIGPGLRVYHGVGLVVNDGSVLGRNVTLRHGVTLGHKVPYGPCPRVGNDVEFGPNSVVIGGVSIGDGATIAAGAVVVHDVAAGDTVVGNPARPLMDRSSVDLE